MSNFKYILRLTVTLLLITAVVAGLLGFVNYLTEDKIREGQEEKAKAAMQEVLAAENYEPVETAIEGINAAYRADELGYVLDITSNGFGGAINMMVGISAEGKITGVSIVSHSETASLGANCTREDFRDQFKDADGALSVKKDGGTVEALTGATVTSRAVTNGVNLAFEFFKEVQ